MTLLSFVGGLTGALYRERRYSADQIRAHRDERLRKLIEHAKSRTVLGAEKLAHIDTSLPINLAQIRPTHKEELLERFEDSIVDGVPTLEEVKRHVAEHGAGTHLCRGRFTVATTSGTTGRVGYFISEGRDFAEQNGALLARILRHRLVPREVMRFSFGRRYRMAMTIATGGAFITRLVADVRPLLTSAFVDTRTFDIMASTERLVHQLNLFRPHYLHGYPTMVEALAHERLLGRLAIDPEFISLGSEPVSRRALASIARAFPRAQIAETYGATECVAIANQCSAGRLHVNEDLAIVEPVDAMGRPVPVGVASDKVYLTNLVNRAQPLLRYELSDSITLLGDDCPCGSPMRSIRVEGRADDTIFLADETGQFSAHPPVPFEVVFLGVPGLRQYQLVHERQNQLVVRVVAEPGADADEVARTTDRALRDYLARARLASQVQVGVELTDSLERTASGHKLRQIYSKVPRPALAAS